MIELIDKIKQKNGGKFFLMDAKDIQYDANDASKGSLIDALKAGLISGEAGTKWYLTTEVLTDGAAVPNDIKDQAVIGDIIMNTDSGDMFKVTGDAESLKITKVGTLKGIKGDQGDKGETGEQGVKGEKGDKGDPFSIAKIFTSVAEMNAGFATDGVAEGSFVLISTTDVNDPDNSKLYVKGTEAYTFITDLSGATGIAGPQGEQGIQGETGATGTSMKLKGEWAATTAYVNDAAEVDVVTYNGSTFACAESHTSTDAFDATKWTLIAQRGTDGAQGETGATGAPGEKGADGTTPHIGENGNWFIGEEDTGKPSRGEGVSETITSDVETLKKQMEDLMYKKIEVTSFSVAPSVVEIGSTVTSVTVNWALSKVPTSANIAQNGQTDSVAVTEQTGTKVLDSVSLTTNTTYKITAKDERDAEASKSASIQFLNGVYSGVSTVTDAGGIVDSVIQGLSKKLATRFTGDYTVNAGEGQYIYFAYPASMTAEPQFYVGGFAGGFGLVKTFDFTNASGHKESYKVYRSANANLGATIVTVK